ncbi:hypothetical protein [Candidatus Synchoanobacter obligatus]|uniref:Alpha/beta hydrolase family protein n=1 Tax=Candidatus Synchoanobacter obligatus TaxID=2919597 RepID=A0ABT1L3B1_9GAMM|nr:hypothetical protein [Candidatus Synchoanobacter obligatus]MCP8351722.1 hypothetical protein [Candidatus Synchoanobacter obligatus]
MILSPGNGMCVDEDRAYNNFYTRYGPAAFGLPLFSLEDTAEDLANYIEFMAEKASNKIKIYGISMGGASLVQALRKLHDRNSKALEKIHRMAVVNTFRSLESTIAAHLHKNEALRFFVYNMIMLPQLMLTMHCSMNILSYVTAVTLGLTLFQLFCTLGVIVCTRGAVEIIHDLTKNSVGKDGHKRLLHQVILCSAAILLSSTGPLSLYMLMVVFLPVCTVDFLSIETVSHIIAFLVDATQDIRESHNVLVDSNYKWYHASQEKYDEVIPASAQLISEEMRRDNVAIHSTEKSWNKPMIHMNWEGDDTFINDLPPV